MPNQKGSSIMRKLCGVVVGLALLLSIGSRRAHAQFKNGSQATELNLPRLSQRAEVIQRIGLTDVHIIYHAPLAGGRELFGTTVPYGKSGVPAQMKTPLFLLQMTSVSKGTRFPPARTACT